MVISCSVPLQCTGKVENLPKLRPKLGFWGSQISVEVATQIVDPISKITPISDLLSYKGCLSVNRFDLEH